MIEKNLEFVNYKTKIFLIL